jgi:hypothetical protein
MWPHNAQRRRKSGANAGLFLCEAPDGPAANAASFDLLGAVIHQAASGLRQPWSRLHNSCQTKRRL